MQLDLFKVVVSIFCGIGIGAVIVIVYHLIFGINDDTDIDDLETMSEHWGGELH